MKKIETLLIKRLIMTSGQDLVSLVMDSLIILSLSHTLEGLEFSWSTLGGCGILGFLEQKGKGRAGKHKRTSRSTTTMGFYCWYHVACIFFSLVLECMACACGLLVMICH